MSFFVCLLALVVVLLPSYQWYCVVLYVLYSHLVLMGSFCQVRQITKSTCPGGYYFATWAFFPSVLSFFPPLFNGVFHQQKRNMLCVNTLKSEQIHCIILTPILTKYDDDNILISSTSIRKLFSFFFNSARCN